MREHGRQAPDHFFFPRRLELERNGRALHVGTIDLCHRSRVAVLANLMVAIRIVARPPSSRAYGFSSSTKRNGIGDMLQGNGSNM